jgi:hypothetical protein
MGHNIDWVEGSGIEGHIRLESEVVATNIVTQGECDSLVCKEWHDIIRLVGDAVVDGGMDSGDEEEQEETSEEGPGGRGKMVFFVDHKD